MSTSTTTTSTLDTATVTRPCKRTIKVSKPLSRDELKQVLKGKEQQYQRAREEFERFLQKHSAEHQQQQQDYNSEQEK